LSPGYSAPPYLLGIDIGGTKTAVVRALADGRIVHRSVIASNAGDGPDAMLQRVIAVARDVIGPHAISHVGVSVGGPVEAATGRVMGPPNLPGWDDIPLRRILADALGLPVQIEHDAKACALAEWRFGAGRGAANVVFLTLGTGLGAGLIVDGRLVRGAGEAAGEIGHWRAAPDGPLAYGKSGSLEGWASGRGLPLLAKFLAPETLSEVRDGEDLCRRAQAGDPDALSVVARSGCALGTALALVVDLLAPERIILGSLAARLGKLFTDPLSRAVAQEALPSSLARCRIMTGELGEAIGDVAAICVAMQLRESEHHAA
jgi:glucokinase